MTDGIKRVEPGTLQRAYDAPHRRNDLPYGCWTTAEGREVLFNRAYRPMWQRWGEGKAAYPADRFEKVQEITDQRWFYNDWHSKEERRERAIAALSEWAMDPGPESPLSDQLRPSDIPEDDD